MSGHHRWPLPRATRRRKPPAMSLFARWLLVQSVFALALTGAAYSYKGHVHPAGLAAAGVVLAIYVAGSVECGLAAWRSDIETPVLEHIGLAIKTSPMVAMLGTVAGFLIAFSGDSTDVQRRVLGASTGLTATFVGISCALVLMFQRHLVEPR